MAEYATKGLANGLGIPALVLGSLGFLNSGGLGGGLGGLLGGGWNNQAAMAGTAAGLGVLAEKDAEIAKLKAEKYSDKNDVEVYAQTRRENQDLSDRLLGNWIKPLAQEAADNKVTIARIEERMNCMDKTSHLREENVLQRLECMSKTADLREQNMCQKIDTVAREAAHGIGEVGMGLAALRNTVSSITRTIIPQTAICPPVMPRYNTWEAPTDTAPATQPINGTVNVANA